MTIHQNEFPGEIPEVVGIDVECTCKDGKLSKLHRDEIVSIQLACGDDVHVIDGVRLDWWQDEICNILEDPRIVSVFHNAVFDLGFLMARYRHLKGMLGVWDTMLVERVLTNGTMEPCDLKSVAWRRAGKLLDKSLQSSFSKGRGLTDAQVEYAARDAAVLTLIRESQLADVARNGAGRVVELENRLAPVVARMEADGMGFDIGRWREVAADLREERVRAGERAQLGLGLKSYSVDLFGGIQGINLNSGPQILAALAGIGIRLPNTREATFAEHLERHPERAVLRDILGYRSADKLLSYEYPKHVNPITRRIHAKFNQTGARTGRFSSSDPNLQNVARDPRVRRCFVPAPGQVFVIADYAQQEMRILAEAAQDRSLAESCLSGDIHLENARIMYGDPSIQKGDPRRQTAKNGGLALMFRAGADTMARTLGVSVERSRQILERLHRAYPASDRWAGVQLRHLHKHGYVETLLGRRRYIPQAQGSDDIGKFGTVACNTPIQGTGADCLKLAMVEIARAVPGARLVACVHDELICEVPEEGADASASAISAAMERAGAELVSCVPMLAEAAVGREWVKA